MCRVCAYDVLLGPIGVREVNDLHVGWGDAHDVADFGVIAHFGFAFFVVLLVAQLAERGAVVPEVVGSYPTEQPNTNNTGR